MDVSSTLRRIAATHMRRLANRLDPRRPAPMVPGPAPLIRLGGRWWHRDDIALREVAPEPSSD